MIRAMPENRQILIASLPTGALRADDYELATTDVPTAGDGEVLVRTLALTIGAGQRAGLQGSASYAGAPTTGVVMGGTGVGRVEVSNVDGIAAGRPRGRRDRLAGLRRAAGPRRRAGSSPTSTRRCTCRCSARTG